MWSVKRGLEKNCVQKINRKSEDIRACKAEMVCGGEEVCGGCMYSVHGALEEDKEKCGVLRICEEE